MVQRGIDTLSVTVDPATLALTAVTTNVAMITGVEAKTRVFARGRGAAAAAAERRAMKPGVDFDVAATTWSTKEDGVPQQGTKYVVETELVVFETDVAPSRGWDPHAGRFDVLWSRTLRQAEE